MSAPPPPPTPQPTALTIAASATTVQAGGTITFSGVLTDQNRLPMGGVTIYLFVNNGLLQQIMTNSAGQYTFNLIFQSAGNYNVNTSTNQNNT